ncbi:hypothetical protein B0H10DRAFT_2245988 [Mycena sp. CBHHK59/15]|nr:hypothetical protein B0H10DRAFT_2245988 [Mycena sp. CBHHK59/15]
MPASSAASVPAASAPASSMPAASAPASSAASTPASSVPAASAPASSAVSAPAASAPASSAPAASTPTATAPVASDPAATAPITSDPVPVPAPTPVASDPAATAPAATDPAPVPATSALGTEFREAAADTPSECTLQWGDTNEKVFGVAPPQKLYNTKHAQVVAHTLQRVPGYGRVEPDAPRDDVRTPKSFVYTHYQRSLNSLHDILDCMQRQESLAELHQYLNNSSRIT